MQAVMGFVIKHHYGNRSLWKVREKKVLNHQEKSKRVSRRKKAEVEMNMRLEQGPEQREMVVQEQNKQEEKGAISQEDSDMVCIRKKKLHT